MERDVGSDELPSGGVDGSDVQPNVGDDRLDGRSLEDTLLTPERLLCVLGTAAASVVISSLHQGTAATAGQDGGVGEGQGGHGYFSDRVTMILVKSRRMGWWISCSLPTDGGPT